METKIRRKRCKIESLFFITFHIIWWCTLISPQTDDWDKRVYFTKGYMLAHTYEVSSSLLRLLLNGLYACDLWMCIACLAPSFWCILSLSISHSRLSLQQVHTRAHTTCRIYFICEFAGVCVCVCVRWERERVKNLCTYTYNKKYVRYSSKSRTLHTSAVILWTCVVMPLHQYTL